ncbi:MAG: DNRLRE domain-containing protein [Acidimicrobiales bacterium]|nr:DNRLRE domain-containing protein [Acidimicrobiales bacterium]
MADSQTGFEGASLPFDLSLAEDAADVSLASLAPADNTSVEFGFEGASSVAPTIDGNVATYTDVQPGVSIELEAMPSGLKETIVLESASAPNVFTFSLASTGLTASEAADGSIAFVDAGDQVRLTIPPGYMFDSAESPATSEAVTYELDENGTELTVTADQAWLADPQRVFPVMVDPTMNIWSEADDTFVSNGLTNDNSSLYVLKAGYDGTRAHRSFLHFDLLALDGLEILAGELALVQNGSGSCTSSPADVYSATEEWDGTGTTAWPGPVNADDPLIGTINSGLGHSGSCPSGFAVTDVTRAVRDWVHGIDPNYGLYLRARDEANAAQFKQWGSSESFVPPTLNVLWVDPDLSSAPSLPTNLTPQEITTTASPVLSGTYTDPQVDDGQLVFFSYDGATGAFLAGYPSSVVDSGQTATYTGSGFPINYPISWQALAVDTVNEVGSRLSDPVPLLRPSALITAPTTGDNVAGTISFTASVDSSITGVTSVEFLVDEGIVATDSSAPYSTTIDTTLLDDGNHTFDARIQGSTYDETLAPRATVYVDNDTVGPDTSEPGEGAEGTVGQTEDANQATCSIYEVCLFRYTDWNRGQRKDIWQRASTDYHYSDNYWWVDGQQTSASVDNSPSSMRNRGQSCYVRLWRYASHRGPKSRFEINSEDGNLGNNDVGDNKASSHSFCF